jgi:SAM-dependent methyltransferase
LKLILYTFYFLRSCTLRGFFNTLKFIYQEKKHELIYEKKLGIKTAALKPQNSHKYYHYQGASYLILEKIIQQIYPHTHLFDFIDIGCGRGRVLFVAEQAGYKKMYGIELDNELVVSAKENLKTYSKKNSNAMINIINQNALDYHYGNKPSVYFFFNPFNEEIMNLVLNKIIAATNSETWFVYVNPLFRKPFEEQKLELVKEIKTKKYLEAVIYKK